jgi:hypothetical protein
MAQLVLELCMACELHWVFPERFSSVITPHEHDDEVVDSFSVAFRYLLLLHVTRYVLLARWKECNRVPRSATFPGALCVIRFVIDRLFAFTVQQIETEYRALMSDMATRMQPSVSAVCERVDQFLMFLTIICPSPAMLHSKNSTPTFAFASSIFTLLRMALHERLDTEAIPRVRSACQALLGTISAVPSASPLGQRLQLLQQQLTYNSYLVA